MDRHYLEKCLGQVGKKTIITTRSKKKEVQDGVTGGYQQKKVCQGV
jgi:hypothetical protein